MVSEAKEFQNAGYMDIWTISRARTSIFITFLVEIWTIFVPNISFFLFKKSNIVVFLDLRALLARVWPSNLHHLIGVHLQKNSCRYLN